MTDQFAGARHNKSDAADMQTLHDIAVRQGASCAKDEMHAAATAPDFYIIENFVATKPGEPYLWMPFGTIKKGSQTRSVTPELAAKFKLPHFKPPIKLGSHDEATPAGGHIVAFDVRADGIWVTPEIVASGEKALAEGAYRYHSPEVIWEDGYIQNPDTGELMPGPFIMGDALLHTPHLGEKTALYSLTRSQPDMETTIPVPASLWEKFTAFLNRKDEPPPPAPQTEEPAEVTQLKAQLSDLEKYKAEIETMKAEAAKAEQLAALVSEIGSADYSATISGDAAAAAAHLLAMPSETREWAKQTFRALSAQISEADLLKKAGKPTIAATSDDPAKAFHAAVVAKQAELKTDYVAAANVVAHDNPDLYSAYKNAGK